MLYVLHGEDEFTRSEQLSRWKVTLGDAATASLNTVAVDGRTISLAELVEVCDALPFLGSRRLVVVDGFWSRFEPQEQGRSRRKTQTLSADDQALLERLEEYLPGMPPTTRLVFVEPGALNPGNPVFHLRSVDKDQVVVKEFRAPAQRNLGRWIERRMKSKGGAITPEAGRELANLVGTDLRQLDQELDKLLAHANFERPVSVDDVRNLVSANQMTSVFDLVDAIGLRQVEPAMCSLHELLDAGAAPLYLLHMIERQFRILLQVKELGSQGAGLQEIQRELGIKHSFVVKKALHQARSFSQLRLESIFAQLADVEQAIKTGRVADLLALDVLVTEVSLGPA